jgi:hypothetical protein
MLARIPALRKHEGDSQQNRIAAQATLLVSRLAAHALDTSVTIN